MLQLPKMLGTTQFQQNWLRQDIKGDLRRCGLRSSKSQKHCARLVENMGPPQTWRRRERQRLKLFFLHNKRQDEQHAVSPVLQRERLQQALTPKITDGILSVLQSLWHLSVLLEVELKAYVQTYKRLIATSSTATSFWAAALGISTGARGPLATRRSPSASLSCRDCMYLKRCVSYDWMHLSNLLRAKPASLGFSRSSSLPPDKERPSASSEVNLACFRSLWCLGPGGGAIEALEEGYGGLLLPK